MFSRNNIKIDGCNVSEAKPGYARKQKSTRIRFGCNEKNKLCKVWSMRNKTPNRIHAKKKKKQK